MEYFVRAMEKHKASRNIFSSEKHCFGLAMAREEAKRMVLASDPAIMLQADACMRLRTAVWTKYRCWINDRGEFLERTLG